MSEHTTEAALAELMSGPAGVQTVAPEDPRLQAPPPSPEILRRVKELQGRGGAVATYEEVKSITPLDGVDSPQVKQRFIAHILGGVPFTYDYNAFNGRFCATFRTLSPAEERALAAIVAKSVPEVKERKSAYLNYAVAVALVAPLDSLIEVDTIQPGLSHDQFVIAYNSWLDRIQTTTFQLLLRWYNHFRELVAEFLRRADEKDFWPTP